MKRLIEAVIILIAALILTGCGSGGGGEGPPALSGKISLTCAEATNIEGRTCGDTEGLTALSRDLVANSIVNSGNLRKSEIVWYNLTAINNTFQTARMYIKVDEGGVAGCEDRNSWFSIYPFDVDTLAQKYIGTPGSMYDICATNGASWANVTIYNGTHLELDRYGNPAVDEALHTTTIRWNFVD